MNVPQLDISMGGSLCLCLHTGLFQETGYKDEPPPVKQSAMGQIGKMGQKESKKTFGNAEGVENKYLQCKEPGPFF